MTLRHEELRSRLEYCANYIVGSNEWERAMEASYLAAEAWLSISSYDYVITILKFMEEEVLVFKQQLEDGDFDGYGYEDEIKHNLEHGRYDV
jgi:hypothetical protein